MKILSYRRDIYLKIKLRTSTIQFQPKKERIFAKKNIFWNFSDFRDMLEDPLKFSMFNFSKISKKKSKNGFTGVYQTLKGTKSWILVNLAQTLWKWQTILDRPGHNGPPPVGIGLSTLWYDSGPHFSGCTEYRSLKHALSPYIFHTFIQRECTFTW